MAFHAPALTAGGPVPPPTQPTGSLGQLAWQRKWFLVVGALVGLAVGALVYLAMPPTYQSTAQVLVVRKIPDVVTGVDTRAQGVEDYVSMHQGLIQSPLIINRAIEQHRLQTLPSLAGHPDLTRTILKALAVTHDRGPAGDSNILQLSFRTGAADDSRAVLDAILQSYQQYVEKQYRSTSDDTLLKLIARARDLQRELADKNAAYEEFRDHSPLLGRGQDSFELRRHKLETLQARQSAKLVRRIEIQGQLQALENARQQGRSRDVLLAMVAEFSAKADPEEPLRARPVTLQDQLLPLLLQEQKLLERYGPNHAEVQGLRKRIAATRAYFAQPAPGWTDTENPAADPVALHVQYLQQKLQQIQIEEQRLAEEYNREQQQAKVLTNYQIKDEHLLADLTSTRQLWEDVRRRLPTAKLIKDVGGYDAQVIAPPADGRKVAPQALLVFPTLAFLGMLAGLGLAYVAARRDQGFHSPDEVRQQLGLPVVGSIPWFRPAARGLPSVSAAQPHDPILCTYFQSKSREAEAFRSVRTTLYFGTPPDQYRTVQVTSPKPGDGKTTLAANLAVSIAQSGKRTLLVDADLRQPKLHQLFGLANAVGLSSVLADGVEPPEAIQPSGIADLSLLPSGPLPSNPAELLTSPRFKELLDWLRGHFDFVVVDTPALLEVTDAGVVASRVDGVLLVLRLSRNTRPTGARATEMLTSLGARVLGVVVNGTDGYAGFGAPRFVRPDNHYGAAVPATHGG